MGVIPTQRALTGRASSNPVWDEIQSLAVAYLALPPSPPAPQADPERDLLRKKIFEALARTWVRMVADDAAGDGARPAWMERHDSELEKVFRAEAAKLERRHGNQRLTQAFGGPTNLAAQAQQAFVESRELRYRRKTQQQTLLSGLLRQWDGNRGSLYTFISRAASCFLIDMARQLDGEGAARLEATPSEWVMASASAVQDGTDQDWLDACSSAHAPSTEQLAETEELMQAVELAVQTLPENLQLLYRLELLKQDEGLTDTEVAARLGLGSRNTLMKHPERLYEALRRHLGLAAAA